MPWGRVTFAQDSGRRIQRRAVSLTFQELVHPLATHAELSRDRRQADPIIARGL
jgi:hypothetical protein